MKLYLGVHTTEISQHHRNVENNKDVSTGKQNDVVLNTFVCVFSISIRYWEEKSFTKCLKRFIYGLSENTTQENICVKRAMIGQLRSDQEVIFTFEWPKRQTCWSQVKIPPFVGALTEVN